MIQLYHAYLSICYAFKRQYFLVNIVGFDAFVLLAIFQNKVKLVKVFIENHGYVRYPFLIFIV